MAVPHQTLIEAVRSSGLSLREISRRSDVSDGNLSRWLRGESGITLASAEKVAQALGLSLRAVLTPEPEESVGLATPFRSE